MTDEPKYPSLDEVVEEIEEESRSQFQRESAINKFLMEDVPSFFQNKKDLGISPGQISHEYTFHDLYSTETYKSLEQQLRNEAIHKVIIHSDISTEAMDKIMQIANKYNIPFTIVKSPEFTGDIGLVLI